MTPDDLMTHWPLLVGTVKKMLPTASHAVWEDVAGDTLERAIRNLHRYEDRGDGPAAWLATIARRLVIDYSRRPLSRPTTTLAAVRRATVDAGWQHHAEAIDVRAAIAALPDELAEYVEYCRSGLDQTNAGRRMGWSKSRSSRATALVRRALAGVAS